LAEALGNVIKNADDEIQGLIVMKCNFIEKAIDFVTKLVAEVKCLNHQYAELINQILTCLAILNSNRSTFRNMFIDNDGLKAAMSIVDFFCNEEAKEDIYEYPELEEVLIFVLSSTCIEAGDSDDEEN
jgi:ribosomal protein L30E